MRKRLGRAGVAVAAVASVAMGFGLAAGAAPAGAATNAAAGSNQLTGVVQQVESLVCLVVDIATGATPPYGPPGDVCAN
ncbi:MAG TPA: hypothetical protein VMP41_05560 [Acidimicrobiales bacterium]|nr:hypothetical protein [Acidimicrobiales bacterium]